MPEEKDAKLPTPAKNPVPAAQNKSNRRIDLEGVKKYGTYLKWALVALIILVFFNPIVVIEPGTVGVVYNAWGGIDPNAVLSPGWHARVPILQSIYPIPTARETINLMEGGDDIAVSAPTKEGLIVNADVSVFFRVPAKQAPKTVQELTVYYRQGTLIPLTRSTVREVAGQMAVSDLYGPGRERFQVAIYDKLKIEFERDGFILEEVLIRNLKLPDTIVYAIEQKLATEQATLQKQYEIDLAQKEAERQKIEAGGIAAYREGVAEGEAKALKVVGEALRQNPDSLKSKQLDTLLQLYLNPNVRWVLPSNQVILPLDLNVSSS